MDDVISEDSITENVNDDSTVEDVEANRSPPEALLVEASLVQNEDKEAIVEAEAAQLSDLLRNQRLQYLLCCLCCVAVVAIIAALFVPSPAEDLPIPSLAMNNATEVLPHTYATATFSPTQAPTIG